MFDVLPEGSDNVVGIKVTETITHDDYQRIFPMFAAAIQTHGTIRVVLVMDNVAGFETGTLWEDISEMSAHIKHFERCCVVGEKKWEKWAAQFRGPAYQMDMKYFDTSDLKKAWAWIRA